MNKLILTCLIAVATLMPAKKADAGIILISGGGVGVLTGALAIGGGGVVSAYSLLASSFCYHEDGIELYGCLGVFGILGVAGVGLIVLDESGQESQYETVPSYLLEEIRDQAAFKGEFLPSNAEGFKFVQFSHEEVDELFQLADEYTSQAELDSLRTLLTSEN